MAIICWGHLAKSSDDTLRIEQSISDYVTGHDENINAHQIPGSALYMHRVNEILDHLPESILNEHTLPAVRTYKAVVDLNGNGDYTNIQDAIGYVNGLGGGRILILSGNYNMTSDLIFYNNIELYGEDRESTILTFDVDHGIQIVGVADDFIRDIIIENLTVYSGEFIHPLESRHGAVLLRYAEKCFIRRCDFEATPAGVSDIVLSICKFITIEHNRFHNTTGWIYDAYSLGANITGNMFDNTCSVGAIRGSYGGFITDNLIYSKGNEATADDAAISVVAQCLVSGNDLILSTVNSARGIFVGFGDNRVSGNYITGDGANQTYGIWVDSQASENTIVGNVVNDFSTCGIYLHDDTADGASNNSVTANTVDNCGNGVTIQGANCSKNIVVANFAVDGFTDNGTATESGHNITV